jgi:hypothetical protein
MLSLQSKLRRIGEALDTALPGLASHYYRKPASYPACIWQEDGEGESFRADFREREQAIHGTVDYFTQTEYDPNIDVIQDVLNGIMHTWRIKSVQYEEETKLIHYEWEWEASTIVV